MDQNGLRPSDFSPDVLDKLAAVLAEPDHVALVDDKGRKVELPAALAGFLLRMARLLEERRTLVLIPEDEEYTTQAAANFLGVSRQHLVGLLESGQIPFHKVGTHRRVVFRDLLAFQKNRDRARRSALDQLAKSVDEAGLYDASFKAD
ncbi:MAG: helix-turn-helix domain-containing protein [Rhodothermales bacterium]